MIICFLVLTVPTGNILVSFYAIVAIASIILTLLSVVELKAWDFGLIPTTCVIVFIGISFDYVIHISHAYL
jgi:hypothetical protein